jgi:hypothetical protein
MKLEICIHCHSYQHRLCWMLSSILQQEGDIPDILVSVSYTPENGNPKTREVTDFFRSQGLNILDIELDEKDAPNRAIPRNMRAKDTEADWILFADGDLVYHPLFFSDLKSKLESDDYSSETKVMGANRYSLNIDFCVKFFEEDTRSYPCLIESVAKIPKEWPSRRPRGAGICAGYFQLARVEAIREKGGIYSGRKRDVWRSTKSDRQFRVHMGGRRPIDVLPMYHLNHDRGGPEIQR